MKYLCRYEVFHVYSNYLVTKELYLHRKMLDLDIDLLFQYYIDENLTQNPWLSKAVTILYVGYIVLVFSYHICDVFHLIEHTLLNGAKN